jgi:hypothetical protein
MADFKRLPAAGEPDENDALVRDRQIDALLEDGLDRYFAGRYEDAIHLWTRVLFLDRSHARARAYIERARTALAELQRRSDELLHTTRDLLEQGDTDAARRLLNEAVAGSGDEVQVSALRVRLERLEQVSRAGSGLHEYSRTGDRTPSWAEQRPAWRAVAVGAALIGLASLAGVLFLAGAELPTERAAAGARAPAAARLPVLTGSEVALVRARTAVARGFLAEALRQLDRVPSDSPNRPEADQMRNDIQQLLLASVRSSSATTQTERIRR